MGIRSDDLNYDDRHDYDDDYGNSETTARYAENGEECSIRNGVMANLKLAKKVVRWTRCSYEDFESYIKANGDRKFCLFVQAKEDYYCADNKPKTCK